MSIIPRVRHGRGFAILQTPTSRTRTRLDRYYNRQMTIPTDCVGVDGCPGGWVAATRAGVLRFETLEALLSDLTPRVLALDMPIGLSDEGLRICDRAARRLLGRPRSSSVFPTPTRAALSGCSHAHASDLNAGVSGRRLSVQTYNILPKIAAVDRLLRDSPEAASRIFETHPEVCFAAMNGGQAIVESKKTAAGAALRQALLDEYFGHGTLARARSAIPRAEAAGDDLADAYACLFTAERIAAGRHTTLPDLPPIDAAGLSMRICY